MSNVSRGARILVGMLAFVCSAVVGCGGASVPPTCKVPDVVELQLEASDRVNLDEDGRSLPTRIRVYQMGEITSLEQSSFEDVWQRSDEVLGSDALGQDELTIYPGQRMNKRLDRNPAANFVVAVAVFRQPAGNTWRAVVELPRPGDPCAESGRESETPPQATLAISVLLEDYRVESIAGFVAPPRGGVCDPAIEPCEPVGTGSDEIRLVGHDGRTSGARRRPNLPTSTAAPSPAESDEGGGVPEVPDAPRTPTTPRAPSAPSGPTAPRSPL